MLGWAEAERQKADELRAHSSFRELWIGSEKRGLGRSTTSELGAEYKKP